MTKIYPAKVSYGLLAFIFIVFFGPLASNVFEGNYSTSFIVIGMVLLLVFSFIANLFFGTKYLINANKLRVKFGPFLFITINISDIKEISNSNSILSAPAPSFDRIEIKFGKYSEVVISPKDKIGIAKTLTSINPKIKNNLVVENN